MKNLNYLSSLNNKKVKFYTLQLANMKRIEENDVVYIFDEVGTGKTISAGLSIIQLLFQHENEDEYKEILVITSPSVTEQFKNKLEGVLELTVGEKGKYKNKEYYIKIINYDYRNISKIEKNKYDFIIIDEAHEFLNDDTKRYIELIKLRAKKIMFMTATPIKHSKEDLKVYCKIASKIIQKNFDILDKSLLDICSDKRKLSGGFECNVPVTRYFKETVSNIEKAEDGKEFRNKDHKRLVPKLWKCGGNVNTFLVDKIDKVNKSTNFENRFVVFVRYIKDTDELKKALEEKGYKDYQSNRKGKTYSIITGNTKNRQQLLREFTITEKFKLPQVLIMTYKISEQGIDLPGYNYVINYHISSSPSQLEQRFGRIDRLNSIHNELNTCFILRNNRIDRDTNTANFYIAIITYINEFLPLIPSKNCLITSNILDFINNNINNINSYYNKLCEAIDSKNFKKVHKMLSECKNDDELDDDIFKLISFYKERNIEFEKNIEEFRKTMKTEVKKCIKQLNKSKERIKWWQENIDEVSNNVFYINTNEDKIDWSKKYDIESIDPKEVALNITKLKKYKEFSRNFKKPLQIMTEWNKYKDSKRLEKYFENLFHENKFELLFPKYGLYDKNEIFKDCKETLKKYLNELVPTLPFFKMCDKYRNIVQSFAYNNDQTFRRRYDFNPFTKSIEDLEKESYNLDICEDFFKNYKNRDNFYIKEMDKKISSSNWLKMIYMYSKPEEFTIAESMSRLNDGQLKIINNKYKSIPYKVTGNDKPIKLKEYIVSDLIKKMFNFKKKNKYLSEEIEGLKSEYNMFFNDKSLFHHFYYNDSNIIRSNVDKKLCEMALSSNKEMYSDNITKEIIKELSNSNWRDVYKLYNLDYL
ncbi:helicase-related protein [Haloimpatiens sp. FM7330]|uniref:helicase-related protein n=1 Tax=Haloimpatiens sp. FM7330 TaxID=3298610 RepID=UPI00362DCF66